MATRKVTILVIEDDPGDQVLIERCLRAAAADATIHILGSGTEAISYLMGEGKYADRARCPYPTFIITDLKMAGTDGFDVLEHIKANPAWAVIPTVVLSSSADPDDVRTAYLLGASAYQSKPDRLEDLCRQMKTLYDYWMDCLVPEVDVSGKQLPTRSKGRLGERFPQPTQTRQARVKR